MVEEAFPSGWSFKEVVHAALHRQRVVALLARRRVEQHRKVTFDGRRRVVVGAGARLVHQRRRRRIGFSLAGRHFAGR